MQNRPETSYNSNQVSQPLNLNQGNLETSLLLQNQEHQPQEQDQINSQTPFNQGSLPINLNQENQEATFHLHTQPQAQDQLNSQTPFNQESQSLNLNQRTLQTSLHLQTQLPGETSINQELQGSDETQIFSAVEQEATEELERKKIEISLTELELSTLNSHISNRTYKRYDQFIGDFLSVKLQKISHLRFYCWLSCTYQYFPSTPTTKIYWKGRFKCKDPKCLMIYDVNISPMRALTVSYTGDANHEKKCKKKQFFRRKSDRERIKNSIMCKGLAQAYAEHVIDYTNQKVIPLTHETFRRIKCDWLRRHRASDDLTKDADATEGIFASFLPASDQRSLPGFIQDIRYKPFGLLFMCDLEIKMWSEIRKKHPVWYFDASGLILPNIRRQSRTVLFNLVAHDVKKKQVIPIAQFFTTNGEAITISSYLEQIKRILELNMNPKRAIAPLIVVDYSDASLNAIFHTFNKDGTLTSYLDWAYLFLVSGKEGFEAIPVKVYLCSFHFFALLKSKSEDILKQLTNEETIKGNQRSAFYFCLKSLLFSCTIIEFTKVMLKLLSKCFEVSFEIRVFFNPLIIEVLFVY